MMKTSSASLHLLFLVLISSQLFGCSSDKGNDKINREELVQRHNVQIDAMDSLSSLTVGNGRFAFTVDATGLQSFPEIYEKGIPLGTQAEWGWHSFPDTSGFEFQESMKDYDFHGRKVSYDVQWNNPGRNQQAANYFRQNPHRLHLGTVGFDLKHADGSPVRVDQLKSLKQILDPWKGQIHSYFEFDGIPVEVITYAHQDMDLIAVQVLSPLIERGLLRIRFHFPYPSGRHADSGCDWDQPDKHSSEFRKLPKNAAVIKRQIDSSVYWVNIAWKGHAEITEKAPHELYLTPDKEQKQFSFSCSFSPSDTVKALPDFKTTAHSSKESWKNFWLSGGAVDFSGSTDPRAQELERRVVLSQYLTRIQCAGAYPPQETGLTYNSWYGKFHLEMHWWHSVHFALWNRTALLEKSMIYYSGIAGKAEETARRQGFEGVRWPKMTDPSGNDSPSSVGSFLIWQQPHYIYLAELCYRNDPGAEILKKYAGLIFSTANFMASYAWYDSLNHRYVLGPALIPAQERFPAETTINPPFELSYWYWGLNAAREWRERLGLDLNEDWDKVLKELSALPQLNGLYLGAESAPDSYTNPRYMTDHPMVLGTFGMLPDNPLLDTLTMRNTFNHIWENWQWADTWGWDFPMVAMSATRMGMPGKAIDALMMEETTNTYLPNGHNYQDERLRLYLPGNGALLTAVAMMCAGYDGSKDDLPGFPKDGTWRVKWEGLSKLP